MGLNIKNERTHALVRELANLTGASQTSAVEDAVRRDCFSFALATTRRDELLFKGDGFGRTDIRRAAG